MIVEDCLSVLLNLLQDNASNQSYFRESSFTRRLVDFFQLNSIGDTRWSAQKVTNVHFLLQVNIQKDLIQEVHFQYIKVIRTLVAPTNSNQNIASCQRSVNQCGKNRISFMVTATNSSRKLCRLYCYNAYSS